MSGSSLIVPCHLGNIGALTTGGPLSRFLWYPDRLCSLVAARLFFGTTIDDHVDPNFATLTVMSGAKVMTVPYPTSTQPIAETAQVLGIARQDIPLGTPLTLLIEIGGDLTGLDQMDDLSVQLEINRY